MNPLLVAHGTRRADRVGRELGQRVRTSFVDVLGPTPERDLRVTATRLIARRFRRARLPISA